MLRMILSAFLAAAGIAAAQDNPPPTVPETLRVAATEKLILRAHGIGHQVYTCKANGTSYAWVLKAPDAKLVDSDGRALGRHFAGPAWESNDGSKVMGKGAASVDSPDAGSIPWLLVNAVGHEGDGSMSHVAHIQRLNTKGGKAPASGCDNTASGTEKPIPYEADYYFYAESDSH